MNLCFMLSKDSMEGTVDGITYGQDEGDTNRRNEGLDDKCRGG